MGTVELGLEYGIPVSPDHRVPSRKEAEGILNLALDAGINFIDTAREYGDSESKIGDAISHRRNEYVLATKVLVGDNQQGEDLVRHVEASVLESLRALKTDFVDVIQIHSATLEMIQRGQVLGSLQRMKEKGAARFIGATTYDDASAMAVIADGGFDCLQVAYNLLDRDLERTVLPSAGERGAGVIARSVLLKGALTHRYSYLPPALDDLKEAVAELDAVAQSVSMSLPEMASRWVLSHPAVSTALVGMASPAELTATVQYSCQGPLESSLMERVRRIKVSDSKQLNPSTWPF